MTAPISVLCLLLTAGTLLSLDPEQAQYRREDGKFTNSPDAISSVVSLISCARSCTAMEPWFCGGFTYNDIGNCDLYKGNKAATCVNPEEAAPPLEVDINSEPRSYRRLQATCPGTALAPCGCPAGFSRCAGRCLALLNQQVNHADAEVACAALGAHLAVPRSEAENQCALDMVGVFGRVFIGATDVITEGTFVGADGIRGPVPASETWWGNGQPDNYGGNEDCIVLWNGNHWGDISCSNTFESLCQLSNYYQPQCQ